MTREIVIAAAKACISPRPCNDCPYRIEGDGCLDGLIADLLGIVEDSEKSTSSDPLTRATFPTSSAPSGHLPLPGEGKSGKALETPAAYPADLMEHRHSGLLEED